MKPQSARVVNGLDAAAAQISLYESPADRSRYGDKPLRGLWRLSEDGSANRPWDVVRFRARQTQKTSRLIRHIAKVEEATALANDVEEVAIFGQGGIGPMPGGSRTGFRSTKPNKRRSARRIANVAHYPVAALAPPVRQVMAAYRLGFTCEAARQFGSVTGHHATSRNARKLCC